MSNPIIVSQMPEQPPSLFITSDKVEYTTATGPLTPGDGELVYDPETKTLNRYEAAIGQWIECAIIPKKELDSGRIDLQAATDALFDLREESTAYRRGLEDMRERAAVIAETARMNVVRGDGAVVGTRDAPPPRIAEAIRKLEA